MVAAGCIPGLLTFLLSKFVLNGKNYSQCIHSYFRSFFSFPSSFTLRSFLLYSSLFISSLLFSFLFFSSPLFTFLITLFNLLQLFSFFFFLLLPSPRLFLLSLLIFFFLLSLSSRNPPVHICSEEGLSANNHGPSLPR